MIIKYGESWMFISLIFLEISMITGRKLAGYSYPVYTTEACPTSSLQWNSRSMSLNCTDKKKYLCIPNDKLTTLLEFCYKDKLFPIEKGICLILNEKTSNVTHYNCSSFKTGCPHDSYWSNEIYKHAECLSIGIGCFNSQPGCRKESCTPIASSEKPRRDSKYMTNSQTIPSTTMFSTSNTSCRDQTHDVARTIIELIIALCACVIAFKIIRCEKNNFSWILSSCLPRRMERNAEESKDLLLPETEGAHTDIKIAVSGCLETRNKRIKVYLATGEFSQIQVDAIITFSNNDLNMHDSSVHNELKHKFGKQIKQAIEKNYFRGLSLSQVANISTENLCCRLKGIYVGVLPRYRSENFQKIIVNCLNMSTGKGIESLCIPCFEDKTHVVKAAQKALEAIMVYDKILSGTTVKLIYIFVEKENLQLHDKIKCLLFKSSPEATLHQDIEKANESTGKLQLNEEIREEKFSIWTEPQIKKGKQEYEFIIENVSVILLQDDITNIKADALINSSNERLDLRWGNVSRMICKKCNENLDEECSEKCAEMKKNKVAVTSGCGLDVDHIIHVDCPITVFDWIERLQAALNEANGLGCQSVSMPLIGTKSFIPFAVETMCEVILVSIYKFKCSHSNTHLKQVKIVAFEPNDYDQSLLFLTNAASTG